MLIEPKMAFVVHIEVIVDPARARGWQVKFIEELKRRGNLSVTTRHATSGQPLPSAVSALLALERLTFRTKQASLVELVDDAHGSLAQTSEPGSGEAGLVIDLTGSNATTVEGRRVVRPLYDGERDDSAAMDALLAGRLPTLQIEDDGIVAVSGTVAIERPECFSEALASVYSRVAYMILAHLESLPHGPRKPAGPSSEPTHGVERVRATSHRRAASFAIWSLRERARSRLNDLLKQGPRWHLAWRNVTDATALPPESLDLAEFNVLRDDGKRFYGDPFAIERGGRRYVFCEEYPLATQRGIISMFTIGDDGTASGVRPILDSGGHLSYPFVFERGGQLWMMPESSDLGRVSLWRCVRFPDTWEEEVVLLQGDLHDATLFEHNGRHWILATERNWLSSTWDTLVAFSAPSLEGPWTPHPANPLQIDPSCSRPGGRIFSLGGRLWRPAQDCTSGYGHALAICEIGELTEQSFHQSVARKVTIRDHRILGPHTFNRDAGLELIDLIARPGHLPESGQAP